MLAVKKNWDLRMGLTDDNFRYFKPVWVRKLINFKSNCLSLVFLQTKVVKAKLCAANCTLERKYCLLNMSSIICKNCNFKSHLILTRILVDRLVD